MNTVTPLKQKSQYVWTGQLGDLIGRNFKNVKSAFVGTCGFGEESLLLITYDCIVKADSPGKTWNSGICNVKVIRFVDVNITVIGDYNE